MRFTGPPRMNEEYVGPGQLIRILDPLSLDPLAVYVIRIKCISAYTYTKVYMYKQQCWRCTRSWTALEGGNFLPAAWLIRPTTKVAV